MKVAVIGLGHIGAVTAAVLAAQGHTVHGVDVDRDLLSLLANGRAPFNEPKLQGVLDLALKAKRLRLSTDLQAAVAESDMTLICVGTPPNDDGSADLSTLTCVLERVAKVLHDYARYHVVVIRSTVPPAWIYNLEDLLQHVSGKTLGQDFGFVVNPEFLREGSAVDDFRNPPYTLIGQSDTRAGGHVVSLYNGVTAPVAITDCRTAAMVKYVSNTFHALKIAFANEVADVAAKVGVDAAQLMEIVAQDTKLNASGAYLRPGEPYGGPCLPKDLTALLRMANVDAPVLAAIQLSNGMRIQRAIHAALNTELQNIVVVGLSFKLRTDDLRGSPYATIVDYLLMSERNVRVYDPDVSAAAAGDYAVLLTDDIDEIQSWAECWLLCKPQLVAGIDIDDLPGHVIDLTKLHDLGNRKNRDTCRYT